MQGEHTPKIDDESLFPNIEVNHWDAHHDQIKQWLSKLMQVEKYDSFWLNKGKYLTTSPSSVVQALFESLTINVEGNLSNVSALLKRGRT